MNLHAWLRLISGSFILISLGLYYFINPHWLFFTFFIALNLIQSAFTNWCPVITLLKKLGVKE